MLSFKNLAARIVGRARAELERDLHERNYPEAAPIPMTDWLAQLDARTQAALSGARCDMPQQHVTAPRPEGGHDPDPDDDDYEDFDCRR